MTSLRQFIVPVILLASANAFAANGSVERQVSSSVSGQAARLRTAQSHWHFLGCVAGPHECEHLAHSRGYHHHQVIDDHHGRCHHPPVVFACLGGN